MIGATLFAVAITTDYAPPILGLYGVLGFVALCAAWVAIGIYRMNRIVLTRDRLIVGRESFVRSDIDIVFSVQPPIVLDPGEQHRVEDLIPLPAGGDVRIVDGSWGRRIGTAMVLLRDGRTGRTLALFSRQPDTLATRLTAWLTTVPDTPAELIDPDDPSVR